VVVCYLDPMKDGVGPLVAGWVVVLTGHDADFSYWERSLKPPFDPWCDRLPGGRFALRSRSFDDLRSADEVRKRAIPLIQQLNGALGVEARAEPLNFNAVGHIDDYGEINLHVFGELNARIRPFELIATGEIGEIRDADGNLISPAPPQPSNAQRWIAAAAENDQIADMLVFAGRADNWFDVYKATELAEKLAGGEHRLRKLLGASAGEYNRMQRTANFHRHARVKNPPETPITLDDTRLLLSFILRKVLEIKLKLTISE
jgi:hypothetical protein